MELGQLQSPRWKQENHLKQAREKLDMPASHQHANLKHGANG